jgi:hypothetical protein
VLSAISAVIAPGQITFTLILSRGLARPRASLLTEEVITEPPWEAEVGYGVLDRDEGSDQVDVEGGAETLDRDSSMPAQVLLTPAFATTRSSRSQTVTRGVYSERRLRVLATEQPGPFAGSALICSFDASLVRRLEPTSPAQFGVGWRRDRCASVSGRRFRCSGSRVVGVRQIALALSRDPSTISQELRRCAATRGGKLDYRALVVQWKADLVAARPKVANLVPMVSSGVRPGRALRPRDRGY